MNQTNGSESSPQPNPGTRRHELERLLDRLERTGTGDTGDYNAIAMLVADAALEADDDTLASGQLWLKRIYSRQLIGGDTSASISEHRGRTLALIDVVQWLLRRVTPQDVAAGLEAGGQPRRFLEFIA